MKHDQIRLSLAYLAIESQTFASLNSSDSFIDLSAFDQSCTIAVLRSLYGGPLECKTAADFEMLWPVIKYLQID